VSEQGERVRATSIGEVLETDEAKALLETGREAGDTGRDIGTSGALPESGTDGIGPELDGSNGRRPCSSAGAPCRSNERRQSAWTATQSFMAPSISGLDGKSSLLQCTVSTVFGAVDWADAIGQNHASNAIVNAAADVRRVCTRVVISEPRSHGQLNLP